MNRAPTSIELFTGGGGLALGAHRAGFRHLLLVEFDHLACQTVRENNSRGSIRPAWPMTEASIYDVDLRSFERRVHLLAAGAPCQPFSFGGLHGGERDRRNLFPEVIRSVREVRPAAVLLENVKGLVRPSFFPYFEYVLWQLERPEIEVRSEEDWHEHKARLGKARARATGGLAYRVAFRVLDAADYGVPQRRSRVVLVALRADTGAVWSWPEPSHSADALAYAKWVEGSYWGEHDLPVREPLHAVQGFVRELKEGGKPLTRRWRTVRDALAGLPDPIDGVECPTVMNHVGIPGARRYKGHDGSALDDPAKTLKAGVHGVPGGEGTVLLDDGSVRYFTIREAARVQTFPDDWVFYGARSHAMRQIGNAVPVLLAEKMASRIRELLTLHRV